MTDFLTRLVQRTSGRASVIKPVVRSSYGSLLHVNETVGEFEETVTFEGIGTPASTDARHTVRNNLLTTGKENTETSQPFVNSEIDNLLVKSPVAGLVSQRQSGSQIRRDSEQVASEGKAVTSADRNIQERKDVSAKKVAKRQTNADAALPVPQRNLRAPGDSVQRKSIGNTLETGTIKARQPSASGHAIREDRATPPSRQNIGITRDVSKSSNRTKQAVSPQSERAAINLRTAEKAAGRQQTNAGAAPPVPQRNLPIAGKSVPRKPVGNIPEHETIVSRQPGIFARAQDRLKTTSPGDMIERETKSNNEATNRQMTTASIPAAVSPGNSHITYDSVRGLSQDMVISSREESAKPGRQGNQSAQQFTVENIVKYAPDRLPGRTAERALPRNESPPSPDIRVTIGRVEIRAVQQPERQAKRLPSAPRKPAVSLDAYLKGRNEEKR